MKNRKLIAAAALLLMLVLLFSWLHLSSREQVAEQCVQLVVDGKSDERNLSAFRYEQISGVRINGKGEEIPVSGQGISLPDLLKQCGVSTYQCVCVVSDDSYSAEVHADEAENAHFLLEEGTLRLIVFGDSNSKRSVSDVKQIIVE